MIVIIFVRGVEYSQLFNSVFAVRRCSEEYR
jgi:hypothetical protein